MARPVRLIPLVLTLALLAACSDDDRGGPPEGDAGPPDADAAAVDAGHDSGGCDEFTMIGCPRIYPMDPIPFTDVCGEFAGIFCRANQNCCSRDDERYPTESQCRVAQVSRCLDMVHGLIFPDAIGAGDVLYSQSSAGAARARIGPMTDECVPLRVDEAVLSAIMGALADGATCVPVACASGLECLETATGPLCQAAPTDGSPCDTAGRCGRAALNCSGGTCNRLLGEGETCGADEECDSRSCAGGTCEPFNADNAYCVRQGGGLGPVFRR